MGSLERTHQLAGGVVVTYGLAQSGRRHYHGELICHLRQQSQEMEAMYINTRNNILTGFLRRINIISSKQQTPTNRDECGAYSRMVMMTKKASYYKLNAYCSI